NKKGTELNVDFTKPFLMKFGKYKDEEITVVFQKDKQYLEYLLSESMPIDPTYYEIFYTMELYINNLSKTILKYSGIISNEKLEILTESIEKEGNSNNKKETNLDL